MDIEVIAHEIERQGADLRSWQAKQAAEVTELRSYMEELETKFFRQGLGGIGHSSQSRDALETKSFVQYLKTGREPEHKAMTVGNDEAGGYLAPAQLELQLTQYLRQRSPMRGLARLVNVSAGSYQMPAAKTSASYAWVGETSARPETDSPTFKMLTVPTCEVYANPSISQNLLDDNQFNLEQWLVQELGEAFGDAESAAFIVGTGVAQPRGLFTYDVVSTADATRAHDAFQYVPTGVAGGGITLDTLISLMHALKPQYRQSASWIMSGEVLELVRKLKDGQGQYLWQPSTQAGAPSTLFGYPVFEDENVPAIATNSLPVCFGDIARSYTITDRGTAILRDPYSNKPYVSFYSSKRLGGGAGRDTRAVKFLKLSTS
jgi:HK97 family phage major capsid protein